MNKLELARKASEATGEPLKVASEVINAFLACITETLANGEDISLVGFGTFAVQNRAARKGRNIRTGEEIEIKAKTVPVFKAGKALKEAVDKEEN